MEETQKETKKKADPVSKPDQKTLKKILELIEIGIPLKKVVFGRTVMSFENQPEFALFTPEPNLKPSRIAKMWYTPHGVICEQKGLYKIIPLANVLDTVVL